MPLDSNLASIIVATAHLKSLSPYSQSRPHQTEMHEKETPADFDKRTWREKAHIDRTTGMMYVPPMAPKMAIADAAAFLGLKIPGRNRATYTKHFQAGVLCIKPLLLSIHKDDMPFEDVFCDSNGVRGSGSRVWRRFPVIEEWQGAFEFNVLDRTITKDVFAKVLAEAGQFIGIGRFRPRNMGYYGRFGVTDLDWSDTAS